MVNKVEAELTFNEIQALKAIAKLENTLVKSSKKMENNFKKVDKAADNMTKSIALGNIAANLATRAFDQMTEFVRDTAREYIEFQQAQVGVVKTTDLTQKELAQLTQQLTELSNQIPVSRNELLRLAEVGGQLGVKGVQNLTKFTETVSKLNVATDLVGEEGAKAILRILNITGEGVGDIERFGDAIVSLGNQARASESEIVRVANEVARGTAQFELSSTQVLALATTLRELGNQAQLGGSVVGKALRQIEKAIDSGGAKLENLQNITGMTGQQLRETFEKDAVVVFKAFLKGLIEANKQGQTISKTLETFGLSGDEVNKVLPVLAKNTDDYARNTQVANQAVEEGTALNEEAGRAFDTLGSKLKVTGNLISNIATDIFGFFTPAIEGAVEELNKFLEFLSKTDTAAEKAFKRLRFAEKDLDDLNKQFERANEIGSSPAILNAINKRIEARKAEIAQLRSQVGFEGPPTPGGTEGKSPEVAAAEERARLLTENEKKLQADIQAIRQEAALLEEERILEVKEAEKTATAEDLERLRQIEEEKIRIRAEAEIKKTEGIKNEGERRAAIQKIQARADLDIEKRRVKDAAKIARQRTAIAEKEAQARLQVGLAAANLGAAIAKDGSKAQFIIQKSAAIAGSIVATQLAAALALATPPGPPTTIPLATKVKTIGALNTAAIAATAIKGFQDGGIIPGPPSPGGADNQIIAAASGELILNKAQQDSIAAQMTSNELLELMINRLDMLIAKDQSINVDGREIARTVQLEQESGFELSA